MTPVLMQASTKHTSTKRMSAQCDKRASAHAHKRLMLSNYYLQVQVQAARDSQAWSLSALRRLALQIAGYKAKAAV